MRIRQLQEDIRFTQYRLSFNLPADTRAALEHRLAGLERELEDAQRRKAA